MEDRAETAQVRFFLCFLLYLFQIGTSSSQCLDNIPQYGSRGTGTPSVVPRLDGDNIYIIPAYTFSCYGKVTQWGACVEGEGGGSTYTIEFAVLRQPNDAFFQDCYDLVDFNTIVSATATDGCITLNVPVSDQISVEPGDVVGLYFSSGLSSNGIEVDTTVSGVTTWYVPSSFGRFLSQFKTGPTGNLPFSTFAAPVITAAVESSFTSTPTPTNPVSSHSPAPSTSSLSHSTFSHSPAPSTSTPSHPTSSYSPAPSTSTPSHSTYSHSPAPSTPSPSHSTLSLLPAPSTPSPSTTPSPSSPAQGGGSTLSTGIIAGIAAGAVGGVLIITIIILQITILFKVRASSASKARAQKTSKSSHIKTKNVMFPPASDVTMIKHDEDCQSVSSMEQNEAYESTTDVAMMQQNVAYCDNVVRDSWSVYYDEVV